MWHTYHAPVTVAEALELLARYGDACRLIAGGTDLILELERGARPQKILIDVSRIPELSRIETRYAAPSASSISTAQVAQGAPQPEEIILGAGVTHNQVVASAEVVAHAFPLARACWLVGAPQIRNRGTVAGNLITASPANDTITPLWAMEATVTLASRERGERALTFDQFFLGVRQTALRPDEMLVRIHVPALKPNERGTFLKLGLRQAQAISVVNVAVVIEFNAEQPQQATRRMQQYVARARIALGAVAPTIIRAAAAEAYLAGKELTDEVIVTAAELAAAATRPISDIRGSAEYRRDMARVLTARALRQLRDGVERADWPERPVLLQGAAYKVTRWQDAKEAKITTSPYHHGPTSPDHVSLTLNGKPSTWHGARGKTLLRALREDAGLTGTKEGCAEGECGACTVWLDGMAVMSCLVPAERAAGCEVVTIEGLADLARRPAVAATALASLPASAAEKLHPLQAAFIEAGAVQCGYCTPGLLMAAANLLQEISHPTADEIKQALAGNLCRCTGYYKILDAVDQAARPMVD